MKTFPLYPKYPERICWGCQQYCPAADLQCGNGSERIQHPIETHGRQWYAQGDWNNLLSPQQMAQIGIASPKPRIILKPVIQAA